MGSIEFDDFPPSHIGAEHSRPIGSFDVEHPITLTRIGRRDGRIVYLEEVRAYLRFEQINKSFQKRQGQKSQPSSHGWCRMAIRVPKADRTVFAGESLVTGNSGTYQLTTSRWPYSSGFAFWTPFRNENSKGWKAIAKRLPASFASGDEFVQALERQPFDYVETDKYVTASISMPPQSNLDLTLNALKKKASFIFGVCDDVDGYASELAHSDTARQLQELTENGTLRFTHKNVDTLVPIKENIKEMAGQILNCSIRQAMAGLHRDDHAEMQNKPLETMIGIIYRSHINDYNRSTVNKEKPKGKAKKPKKTFSLQENDQNSARIPSLGKIYSGIEVVLLPSLSEIMQIPNQGHNQLIIARIHDRLHLRFFSEDGEMAKDSDLDSRSDSEQIRELKEDLATLWPPHRLTDYDRVWLIQRVADLLS